MGKHTTNDYMASFMGMFWIASWFMAIPLWFVYHSDWGIALAVMGLFAIILGMLFVESDKKPEHAHYPASL